MKMACLCKEQYKPENHDLLSDLVVFEKNVQEIPVDCRPKVSFGNGGKTISIDLHNKIFSGNVDRKLIHQIGGRIWAFNSGYDEVQAKWRKAANEDLGYLGSLIADTFTQYDLKIRFTLKPNGLNHIYGIVTPHFVEVDQLAFRSEFLNKAAGMDSLIPQSQGVYKNKFGNVIEFFNFDSPGYQVEYNYGLVYARNTGYDAYKVEWGRCVLVCSNGLTRWEGSKFNWKHNGDIDLSDFITMTINDGVGHQQFIEQRIEASTNSILHRDTLEEFLSRLSLAKSTKERISSRLMTEAVIVGSNEWALSQALTYLGTHDRHISFRAKKQLNELGTEILENSLENLLDKVPEAGNDGYYGLVIPESFVS
jgi:hypothetical protein